MQITINLPDEQLKAIALKMGWTEKIEDTTQDMVDDTYPLIDNPVTLQSFTEEAVNAIILDRAQAQLRAGIKATINNLHNQADEKLSRGEYDTDLFGSDTHAVLQKILNDLVVRDA